MTTPCKHLAIIVLFFLSACTDSKMKEEGANDVKNSNAKEMNNSGHEYDTSYQNKGFSDDYRAYNIDLHMRAIADWVDWETTADRFKAGDPAEKMRKIGVAWMGSLNAMKQAHEAGCNVLVVHEPIYYNHFDNHEPVEEDPGFLAKKAFLDSTGMIVYRCHDAWDYMPGIGVRDSWARQMGLDIEDTSAWSGNHNARVFDLPSPMKLSELAGQIRDILKPYGQNYLRLAGDPEKHISKLGLGTGMVHGIGVLRVFQENGADAIVATELMEWRDVHWALENGLSIIHLSHGVSESKGIENLAAYLQKLFPKIEVMYIPSGNNPYSLYHETTS